MWKRAFFILWRPASQWKELSGKPVNAGKVLAGLIVPLVVISTLVRLVDTDFSIKTVLTGVLFNTLVTLTSIIIGSYMICKLAPKFLSEATCLKVLNLVSYSYLPVFITFAIAGISSHLELVKFLGLYSVYLYWHGLSFMIKTPGDRKAGFTFISLLILTGIGYFTSILLNSLII